VADYAGELTLDEAWARLREEPEAVLVDVRTRAEWTYVGVPDLAGIGKDPRLVEWISYPDGATNPDFLAEATAGLDPAAPILCLCRSGVRSLAAARALTGAGFTRAYNITAGFEGDLDAHGHRTTGWRHAGLPWQQS
jgi:rhodanese-related sulfurtransferase